MSEILSQEITRLFSITVQLHIPEDCITQYHIQRNIILKLLWFLFHLRYEVKSASLLFPVIITAQVSSICSKIETTWFHTSATLDLSAYHTNFHASIGFIYINDTNQRVRSSTLSCEFIGRMIIESRHSFNWKIKMRTEPLNWKRENKQ